MQQASIHIGVIVALFAICTACASAQAGSETPAGGVAAPTSLVSSPAVAQANAPSWMTDLYAAYPEARYLASLGQGDGRRDAESDASGALARLFNVNIKADSVATQRYIELTSQGQTLTQDEVAVVQSVGSIASENFTGLKFSDSFTDKKGRVYVVAYLEREPTAALYKTLLNKDLSLIKELKGRAVLSTGLMATFALYDSAVQVSLNDERLLGQLRIIHPVTARSFEGLVKTNELVALRDAAAKKVTYVLAIDGDKDGKVGGIVRKALAGLKLTSQANGALSIKGTLVLEPVTVNPKYKSVRWTINLEFVDETGTSIASYFKEDRENAISDAEAKAFAYQSIEKEINDSFIQAINDYLVQVAVGK